jgi:hypothetical protein
LNSSNGFNSSNGLTSPAGLGDDWFRTEGNREFLGYLARCALSSAQELRRTVDGVTYTFPGQIGLAPDWLEGPLDTAGEEWISACLLAHMNKDGNHVPIELRAEHAAIGLDAGDAAFDQRECAFAGNLFASPPRTFVGCRTSVSTFEPGGSVTSYVSSRIGDIPGVVNVFHLCDEDVCAVAADGAATACNDTDRVWDRPITVYLQDLYDAVPGALYGVCAGGMGGMGL